MENSSFLTPTSTENNPQIPSQLIDPLTLLQDSNKLTYTSASALAAPNGPTTQVNTDGTYTVAGWTWNPSNAVTGGSIISGESAISYFASGFLENEREPFAKQTVGSLLLNQSNSSLILGNSNSRAAIELTWGGRGLANGLGNDFVVYENGDIGAPEGYAVAVRLAGSNTFTAFRYEFYDTFESQLAGNPEPGVLATAFDLSDFGLANGQSIDAIRIINLQPDDLVNGVGQGFLSTSGTSPLDPSTGQPFALGRLDPDITFVAGLYPVEQAGLPNFDIVGTGDFNLDGQSDILWRDQETGRNIVWILNGTNRVSSVELPSVDSNWDIKGTGDFNLDGQTDILWRNETAGENVLWLMNGTQFSSGAELIPVRDLNFDIKGTGDFNGDGQTDILWRNEATGDDVVWFMNNIYFSSGAFLNPNPLNTPNFDIVGTGDFNRDGQSDIIWRNETTGENVVWLMNGVNFVAGVNLPPVASNWVFGGTGQFNGDGETDLLWQDQDTGEIVAWLLNGTQYVAGAFIS